MAPNDPDDPPSDFPPEPSSLVDLTEIFEEDEHTPLGGQGHTKLGVAPQTTEERLRTLERAHAALIEELRHAVVMAKYRSVKGRAMLQRVRYCPFCTTLPEGGPPVTYSHAEGCLLWKIFDE